MNHADTGFSEPEHGARPEHLRRPRAATGLGCPRGPGHASQCVSSEIDLRLCGSANNPMCGSHFFCFRCILRLRKDRVAGRLLLKSARESFTVFPECVLSFRCSREELSCSQPSSSPRAWEDLPTSLSHCVPLGWLGC